MQRLREAIKIVNLIKKHGAFEHLTVHKRVNKHETTYDVIQDYSGKRIQIKVTDNSITFHGDPKDLRETLIIMKG